MKRRSLSRQLLRFAYETMFVSLLPVVLSIVLLQVFAEGNNKSIRRMEVATNIKPKVDSEISDKLWMAMIGEVSFEECGAMEVLYEITGDLDALIAAEQQADMELLVARRTMETMEQYVEVIRDNIALRRPFAENETVLEEVRTVAILVDDMLERHISREVERVSARNTDTQKLIRVSILLAIMTLAFVYARTTHAHNRMQRDIREPLEALEGVARRITQGDFATRASEPEVQELFPLTTQVNEMADRIEKLIEENLAEQNKLRKAELKTLQSQINPHFLYNTLDAIVWQAEEGYNDEVIRLTKAISDFYRISLSSGEDWIPLSQEIKHVEGYLFIQKIRYRDILRYEIDKPEDMEGIYVVKLLLQPLVENAIYHGIKDKRGGGLITVRARIEGNTLCFTVEDTGKGMTREKLSELRDALSGKVSKRPPEEQTQTDPVRKGSGFGMLNVDERVRLYYGLKRGLYIESDETGTKVSYRVPIRRKEDVFGA